MKKIQLLLIVSIFTLLSCEKNKDPDYREKFCGKYNVTISSSSYSMLASSSNVPENIDAIATVEKFEGYTVLNGSNYYDLEHKLGIKFDDEFTFDTYASACNDTMYLTHGYIHPTVSEQGELSYPEFTCNDFHSQFKGEFKDDSIKISYGYYGLGAGWSKKITGTRVKN